MSLIEKIDVEAGEAPIEPGRQLIKAGGGGSLLAGRVTGGLRLLLRAPFAGLRLGGRPPLKLVAVPKDPVAGDRAAGEAMLKGRLVHRGATVALKDIDFRDFSRPADFTDYLHSFEWLRDLAAAATRERASKAAEKLVARWLEAHAAQVTEPAWRPDLWGRRILFWTAYAPYVLSSRDAAYRALFLKTLARGARHADRSADRAPAGLRRVTAWAGAIAAGLLLQGSPTRLARGEAGLMRALSGAEADDGGLLSRSPVEQLALVELLGQLRSVYIGARQPVPDVLAEALEAASAALLGVTLGDEMLSSWQGGNPASRRRLAAVLEGTGIRVRPLRHARAWGYQRLEAKNVIVVMDAAPPPTERALSGGCASTLAFELSDGAQRVVVNCGGAGGAADALPEGLVAGLRTTAAHSTLTLGDRNSTALLDDGTLGKGVTEVELGRDETGGVGFVEASHDGYVRRFGLSHQRQLTLSSDGRELSGQDVLIASARRRGKDAVPFAVRFHLHPGIEVASTADGQGALLRVRRGSVWQFRCRGGQLAVEESLWVDGSAVPHATQQLVVSGESPRDGATIAWTFRRAA